jgi:hypothetical protein
MRVFPGDFEFCIEKSSFNASHKIKTAINSQPPNNLQKLVSKQPKYNNRYSPSGSLFLDATSQNEFKNRRSRTTPICRLSPQQPITRN